MVFVVFVPKSLVLSFTRFRNPSLFTRPNSTTHLDPITTVCAAGPSWENLISSKPSMVFWMLLDGFDVKKVGELMTCPMKRCTLFSIPSIFSKQSPFYSLWSKTTQQRKIFRSACGGSWESFVSSTPSWMFANYQAPNRCWTPGLATGGQADFQAPGTRTFGSRSLQQLGSWPRTCWGAAAASRGVSQGLGRTPCCKVFLKHSCLTALQSPLHTEENVFARQQGFKRRTNEALQKTWTCKGLQSAAASEAI